MYRRDFPLLNIDKTQLQKIGESLDKLMSLDLTSRGAVLRLYDAARKLHGEPLTAAAAGALADAIQPGDRVLIITGFPSRSWLMEGLTETDGPVGAAVLARALEQAFGAIPIIVTEERLVEYSVACVRAAGLLVTDLERALRSKPVKPTAAAAAVIPFTTSGEEAPSAAISLLDALKPAAVMAVEMPGRAVDGRHYNVSGREIPAHLVARGDALFEEANRRGILTIGFGDGGNELGMGRLASVVAETVPHGDRVASVIPAQITVAGCISNWGAYAVAAAVSAAANAPEILQQIEIERIIARCVDLGAIDGLTARPDSLVDGTPTVLNRYVIDLMQFVVRQGLIGWVKG
jgi:D-glutamate cyclase